MGKEAASAETSLTETWEADIDEGFIMLDQVFAFTIYAH